MPSHNGESAELQAPLELNDVLHIETTEGASLEFEVVGILEDPEAGSSYAVLWHEAPEPDEGEFIVTDLAGNLLEDDATAQQVLDDFLASAEET